MFGDANIGSKTKKTNKTNKQKQRQGNYLQSQESGTSALGRAEGPRASGYCKALFLGLGVGITWVVALSLFAKLYMFMFYVNFRISLFHKNKRTVIKKCKTGEHIMPYRRGHPR